MFRILKLLREPSTYAGIAGLVLSLGISNEEYQIWTTAIAGVAGLVAMLLTEGE
jgi:predicted permease